MSVPAGILSVSVVLAVTEPWVCQFVSVPAGILSVSVVLAVTEPWAFEILSVSSWAVTEPCVCQLVRMFVSIGTYWDFFWLVSYWAVMELWVCQLVRMFVSVPAEIFLVNQLLSCDRTLRLSACQNVCVDRYLLRFFWLVSYWAVMELWVCQLVRMFVSVPAEILSVNTVHTVMETSVCQNVCISTCRDLVS